MSDKTFMSDEFVAYPATPQFDAFRKTYFKERSTTESLDFHGTVKIHGTNISIVYNSPESWHIQSRNRTLSLKNDVHGCFAWLSRAPLDQMATQISEHTLWNKIIIVGEWAGKGIQKGVGVNKIDKFFVIFNICVDGYWQDIRQFLHVSLQADRIFNIGDVPSFDITINFSSLDGIKNADEQLQAYVHTIDQQCPVAAHFGFEGPGEGLVFTHYPSMPSRQLFNFKVKGPSHQVVNVDKLRKAPIPSDVVSAITSFVEYAVTDARLDQGISYLDEMQIPVEAGSIGKFIGWVVRDVLKEEGHNLGGLNLKEKDVKAALTAAVKEGWKIRLKAFERQDLVST